VGDATGQADSAWPSASIVVPAHNEEAVIGANLRTLLDSAELEEFDIIVVANACDDRTAEIARTAGVRVINVETPGKAHAIAIGDLAARTFPRIYLDADVRLSTASVRALITAIARPGILACAPVPRFDMSGVGRFIGRVHRVHDQLIAPNRALAGTGVYVLTEEGHARVFPMPADVISDDGWVHTTFTPSERLVVSAAASIVRPARTVAAHLNRRVRVRHGNRQLAGWGRSYPEGRLGVAALLSLVRRRAIGPLDAGCYLSVLVVDRALTRIRRRDRWAGDDSSRVPEPLPD
jgi:glycosyltransferase involved in cell wall biosynthesis